MHGLTAPAHHDHAGVKLFFGNDEQTRAVVELAPPLIQGSHEIGLYRSQLEGGVGKRAAQFVEQVLIDPTHNARMSQRAGTDPHIPAVGCDSVDLSEAVSREGHLHVGAGHLVLPWRDGISNKAVREYDSRITNANVEPFEHKAQCRYCGFPRPFA